eukprot:gene8733-4422_t
MGAAAGVGAASAMQLAILGNDQCFDTGGVGDEVMFVLHPLQQPVLGSYRAGAVIYDVLLIVVIALLLRGAAVLIAYVFE